MTDKEKVLKVYPEAFCGRGTISGICSVMSKLHGKELGWAMRSEEAAWQNAAESLPAQPEQDDPLGINAALRMTKGHLELSKPEPVAPVEAKAKETIAPCPFCGEEPEETHALDRTYFYVGCANEYCTVQPETGLEATEELARRAWNWEPVIAEPKPTPPTPSEVEEKAVPSGDAATGTLDGYPFHIRKDIPEDTIWAGTKAGAYLILKYPAKPQPDSSSITDAKAIERRMNGEFASRLMAFRKELDTAGLHGHYSIFQKHFGDDIHVSSTSIGRCPYCMGTKEQCFDNEYCASTHWPGPISSEQMPEPMAALFAAQSIKALHASLIDLIDKTQSCTSGLSFGECLEEIRRRLENEH